LFKCHTDKIPGVQSDYAFEAIELPAKYEDVRNAIRDKIEV
jgi:hypothetical protein